MSLGLDIAYRGRPTREVECEFVRVITEADLPALMNDERAPQVPALKRLKDRHHALARALASGMTEGVAAVSVGLGPQMVRVLLRDPAFKELLEFYRAEANAAYRSLHEELAGISMDAAAEIRRRLEDDEIAQKISLDSLVELTKMGADRTGFGPQSKSTVAVQVDFGARLEAARKRVAERKMIDVTPEAAE